MNASSWGGRRSLLYASKGLSRAREDNGWDCRCCSRYSCLDTFLLNDPRTVICLVTRNLALPFEIKNAGGFCRVVFCIFKLVPGRLVKGIITRLGSGVTVIIDRGLSVWGVGGGIDLR